MSNAQHKAIEAARALARHIALHAYQGSVLVWEDGGGLPKIVVCAEPEWIRLHTIPKAFHGYRVEVQHPLDARSH